MKALIIATLALCAGTQPVHAQDSCTVSGVDFGLLDEGGIFRPATLQIEVTTSPSEVQRSLSGLVTIYYKYRDPRDGRIRKSSGMAFVNDSAPEGEAATEIEISFAVFGEVTMVYDIQFSSLKCEIS